MIQRKRKSLSSGKGIKEERQIFISFNLNFFNDI